MPIAFQSVLDRIRSGEAEVPLGPPPTLAPSSLEMHGGSSAAAAGSSRDSPVLSHSSSPKHSSPLRVSGLDDPPVSAVRTLPRLAALAVWRDLGNASFVASVPDEKALALVRSLIDSCRLESVTVLAVRAQGGRYISHVCSSYALLCGHSLLETRSPSA